MDTDAAFEAVRKDLAEGNMASARDGILGIAQDSDDPFVLVKCLSLMKVMDCGDAASGIAAKAAEKAPEDEQDRAELAGALRGLDFPMEARGILKGMTQNDAVVRMSALCLMDMDEYELALAEIESIEVPTARDRIMLTETYSALGEHAKAVSVAEALLSALPREYEVMRCYVSALILGGRDKEAVKYVRSVLKDKTADANAIAAYVMRVTGNIKAAGGYATRAVQLDNHHVGAMETLGICLAEKGETDKARIIAGAINETSPGNKAALNVLSYCDKD